MIYLSQQNVSNLGFLVKNGRLFVETSIKAVRVSMVATTELTTTEMSQHFLDMATIVTNYKTLTLFTSSATLSTKYLTAISPGEIYLAKAKDLYKHLYTFMTLSLNWPPESTCMFNYTLVEKAFLAEGVKYLKAKQLELSGLVTGLDTSADKENQATVENFIGNFNSICYMWYVHIATVISNLDTLDGLEFPENLKGHLESLSCLEGEGIEFEKIKVISSKPGKLGLTIELDIGVPSTKKEMIRLTPVTYNGVQLRGEDTDIHFAQDWNNAKVKLLNCTVTNEWVNEHAPICHELKIDDNCKAGLMANDVMKVLKNCLFRYSNPPFAIRLGDNGILVQRNGLTVTNGGNAVYQAPPYVLYTKSEVKISLKGEELVFPGLTIPSVEGTVTSSLTAIDILAMTTKCYWDTLWINFDYNDYVEWLALALEVILFPLTLIGICLGVKNKVARRISDRKLSKARRQQNQRETRALLRESRL